MSNNTEPSSPQPKTKKLASVRGIPMQPHPTSPVFYFTPFIATFEPELDFNNTPYYAKEMEYYHMADPLPVKKLRDQLIQSLDYNTTTFIRKSVMEVGDNDGRPAYYPILSDLEGYCKKGVGAFVKWVCEKRRGEDETFIPPKLVPMFDLKPRVKAELLPLFTLPLQERHLFFSHKSADIHVMEVHDEMKMIHVNVFACKTEKSKVRYHRVSIYGDKDNELSETTTYPLGSIVIVWNARCVHRPFFGENFTKLFKAYTPNVVVVTEARADTSMTNYIKAQLQGMYEVDTFGTYNGYSGVLLIWDKKDVFPWNCIDYGGVELLHFI